MIEATRITTDDDLGRLVEEINRATWDAANDIEEYQADHLAAYLDRPDTVFVACHENHGDNRTLLGIASGRLEMKPYDREMWLYVDEVDVCVDQRRRGAGRALMAELFAIARGAGCDEVWLGTEPDNHPANGLYRSLSPNEEVGFVGYTWRLSS